MALEEESEGVCCSRFERLEQAAAGRRCMRFVRDGEGGRPVIRAASAILQGKRPTHSGRQSGSGGGI
jgi:hypothetical protein